MFTIIYPNRHTNRMTTIELPNRRLGMTVKEELLYETSIEVELLDRMARRAAENAHGICVRGPVKVTIIEKKQL